MILVKAIEKTIKVCPICEVEMKDIQCANCLKIIDTNEAFYHIEKHDCNDLFLNGMQNHVCKNCGDIEMWR